ncbi:MAG: hypothetical protein AB1430_08945 [Pseudomonadota bacterium]
MKLFLAPHALGLCALLLALGPAALAQPVLHAAREGPRAGAALVVGTAAGPMQEGVLVMAGSELERERVIKGAPYCADVLHESVQTLADGNRIVQRQQGRLCRDGQGRTRQELAAAGRRSVFLRDPVAQEAWLLEVDAQQAVRLLPPPMGTQPHEPSGRAAGEAATGLWQRVRDWGRELRERWFGKTQQPSAEAGAIAVAGGGTGVGVAGTAAQEGPPMSARVLMRRQGPMDELPPPLPGAVPPPNIAFHARLLAPRGPGVVTPLPPETLEGLKAEGRRTTWTIDAGRIGNEKPIVIVQEVWVSPELGITLRSRDFDPTMGEALYRLHNLKRGEPDASLFRVPADYRRIVPPAPPMLPARE